MAKKKATKPETKSEFLRRVLSRNPDLDYQQVLRRWALGASKNKFQVSLASCQFSIWGWRGLRV
jgi:hypothetical protein